MLDEKEVLLFVWTIQCSCVVDVSSTNRYHDDLGMESICGPDCRCEWHNFADQVSQRGHATESDFRQHINNFGQAPPPTLVSAEWAALRALDLGPLDSRKSFWNRLSPCYVILSEKELDVYLQEDSVESSSPALKFRQVEKDSLRRARKRNAKFVTIPPGNVLMVLFARRQRSELYVLLLCADNASVIDTGPMQRGRSSTPIVRTTGPAAAHCVFGQLDALMSIASPVHTNSLSVPALVHASSDTTVSTLQQAFDTLPRPVLPISHVVEVKGDARAGQNSVVTLSGVQNADQLDLHDMTMVPIPVGFTADTSETHNLVLPPLLDIGAKALGAPNDTMGMLVGGLVGANENKLPYGISDTFMPDVEDQESITVTPHKAYGSPPVLASSTSPNSRSNSSPLSRTRSLDAGSTDDGSRDGSEEETGSALVCYPSTKTDLNDAPQKKRRLPAGQGAVQVETKLNVEQLRSVAESVAMDVHLPDDSKTPANTVEEVDVRMPPAHVRRWFETRRSPAVLRLWNEELKFFQYDDLLAITPDRWESMVGNMKDSVWAMLHGPREVASSSSPPTATATAAAASPLPSSAPEPSSSVLPRDNTTLVPRTWDFHSVDPAIQHAVMCTWVMPYDLSQDTLTLFWVQQTPADCTGLMQPLVPVFIPDPQSSSGKLQFLVPRPRRWMDVCNGTLSSIEAHILFQASRGLAAQAQFMYINTAARTLDKLLELWGRIPRQLPAQSSAARSWSTLTSANTTSLLRDTIMGTSGGAFDAMQGRLSAAIEENNVEGTILAMSDCLNQCLRDGKYTDDVEASISDVVELMTRIMQSNEHNMASLDMIPLAHDSEVSTENQRMVGQSIEKQSNMAGAFPGDPAQTMRQPGVVTLKPLGFSMSSVLGDGPFVTAFARDLVFLFLWVMLVVLSELLRSIIVSDAGPVIGAIVVGVAFVSPVLVFGGRALAEGHHMVCGIDLLTLCRLWACAFWLLSSAYCVTATLTLDSSSDLQDDLQWTSLLLALETFGYLVLSTRIIYHSTLLKGRLDPEQTHRTYDMIVTRVGVWNSSFCSGVGTGTNAQEYAQWMHRFLAAAVTHVLWNWLFGVFHQESQIFWTWVVYGILDGVPYMFAGAALRTGRKANSCTNAFFVRVFLVMSSAVLLFDVVTTLVSGQLAWDFWVRLFLAATHLIANVGLFLVQDKLPEAVKSPDQQSSVGETQQILRTGGFDSQSKSSSAALDANVRIEQVA